MTVPYKNNRKLPLENKIPFTCMMKIKATITNITYPAMMEECEIIYDFPSDTSSVVMDDSVNDEHEDSIRKYLVEKNDTKVTDEAQEISIET